MTTVNSFGVRLDLYARDESLDGYTPEDDAYPMQTPMSGEQWGSHLYDAVMNELPSGVIRTTITSGTASWSNDLRIEYPGHWKHEYVAFTAKPFKAFTSTTHRFAAQLSASCPYVRFSGDDEDYHLVMQQLIAQTFPSPGPYMGPTINCVINNKTIRLSIGITSTLGLKLDGESFATSLLQYDEDLPDKLGKSVTFSR